MKRWFTFLLIVVTLAGTFIPCTSAHGHDERTTSVAHHDSQETDKACAPFYSCESSPDDAACMYAVPVLQPIYKWTVLYESMIDHIPSHPAADCWQPPRA